MQRIEFYFFQCFKWLVLAMPLRSAQRFGAYLGSLAYYVVFGRRRIALDNLRHAFPEKTEKERRKIARGAFRNFAIAFVELLWFPNLNDGMIRSLVRLRNPELLLEAYKQWKGMVMLAGHFGNWELIAMAVGYLLKIPVTIIVQTQANKKVDAVINRHRCLLGNRIAPRGAGVREIIRTLKGKGVIALAPDQSGPQEGVFVEFFGRLVASHQGPAVFALKTGAPLQMGFMIRQPEGTYEVILHDIDYSDLSSFSEENVLELTRRHTALLEKYIRMYPDHWLWMHRRWKHTSVERERVEDQAVQDKVSARAQD